MTTTLLERQIDKPLSQIWFICLVVWPNIIHRFYENIIHKSCDNLHGYQKIGMWRNKNYKNTLKQKWKLKLKIRKIAVAP